ncbi:Transmembrane and tpr repeat-containing protein 1, partial [Globisporangium splendens]
MKRQEALAYFLEKTQTNPMDADAHHHLSVLYRSAGEHELHARHARIATLTQHGGPKVWNEMALALMEQGKLDEARAKLEETIAYWPAFAYAYVNMSVIFARNGRYTEALPYCHSALKYAPHDPALHRNIAKVYEQLGRTVDALTHYQRALALDPEDSELAKRIALLSLSQDQTTTSVTHYTHYRALKGDHFDLKL